MARFGHAQFRARACNRKERRMTMKVEIISEPETTLSSSSDYEHEHRLFG
jgi:hypothetical protein